ncbi:MAG: BrnT family toxin [Candidatus Thiothrix sulfatifontis]|nr:MAG: BrnT family toxin [Candidatus Thiothrix sulfatifontis]
MSVEWDKEKTNKNNKEKLNEAKHSIRLSDVEPVLYDPMGVTSEDVTAEGEHRFITVGADMFGRVLTVVYTWRGDNIRLISARKATNKEKRHYESGI